MKQLDIWSKLSAAEVKALKQTAYWLYTFVLGSDIQSDNAF